MRMCTWACTCSLTSKGWCLCSSVLGSGACYVSNCVVGCKATPVNLHACSAVPYYMHPSEDANLHACSAVQHTCPHTCRPVCNQDAHLPAAAAVAASGPSTG
ncbi:hypothetical protein COO60DRAFT_614715 [Scenedesmus sp. NREL 46B-D3]|nr:hypothetical protein COO60DRAFT_614715 [Scenedesmus sp. NREL 46B-D3]